MSCAEFPHMTYPRPITLMTNVTIFLGITLTDMTTHGVLNMSWQWFTIQLRRL